MSFEELANFSVVRSRPLSTEDWHGRWLQNWLHTGWTFLDDFGRRVASKSGFQAFLDRSGRVWTARRVLHNRRLQVRFLSHLP